VQRQRRGFRRWGLRSRQFEDFWIYRVFLSATSQTKANSFDIPFLSPCVENTGPPVFEKCQCANLGVQSTRWYDFVDDNIVRFSLNLNQRTLRTRFVPTPADWRLPYVVGRFDDLAGGVARRRIVFRRTDFLDQLGSTSGAQVLPKMSATPDEISTRIAVRSQVSTVALAVPRWRDLVISPILFGGIQCGDEVPIRGGGDGSAGLLVFLLAYRQASGGKKRRSAHPSGILSGIVAGRGWRQWARFDPYDGVEVEIRNRIQFTRLSRSIPQVASMDFSRLSSLRRNISARGRFDACATWKVACARLNSAVFGGNMDQCHRFSYDYAVSGGVLAL